MDTPIINEQFSSPISYALKQFLDVIPVRRFSNNLRDLILHLIQLNKEQGELANWLELTEDFASLFLLLDALEEEQHPDTVESLVKERIEEEKAHLQRYNDSISGLNNPLL
ncbi:hypothetical protein SAMN05518672_10948 [Chitinophaga sp. CF118]|uniref:hypothetical protein n=1 Tax=Chitinophaga sp. CF118 TaxID=1884367 RepID=UPI0008F1982C|nr:hypothetical protein [Chitinophaga sp. CF118]SFE67910.1 hypothetical protein SAMN05518672_10948 [Chitinophaga sp. CF118]